MREIIETADCEGWVTTNWTSVIHAMRSSDQGKAAVALQIFCEQYRDVFFNFFKRRVGADLAENYTQEFFAKNIQAKWAERSGVLFNFRPEPNGRFRYYLKSALNWFLLDMRKRKSDPIDKAVSEMPELSMGVNDFDLIKECDREVAFEMVRRVMKKLQISEVYLQYFCGQLAANEAAAKLAISPGYFRVAVHRLVPSIKQAFQEEVRPMVSNEADLEDEIRHLVKIIAENCNAAP